MSQGTASLRTRALHALIDAGTWVSRVEMDTLSTCVPAVDDALADLVVEGLAEHRPNVGYRLAASAAVRRAALIQRRTGKRLATAGMAGRDFYSLGVAQERPDVGLVLFELQVPNPKPGAPAPLDHLQRVLQEAIAFTEERGGSHA
jgi:hypothetical protein